LFDICHAILVNASATAKRAEAAGFNNATGGRSPLPLLHLYNLKLVVVTAASATGTCHGPTI
jgi:hypothetical protein